MSTTTKIEWTDTGPPLSRPDAPGWWWARFDIGGRARIVRPIRVYAMSSGDLWCEWSVHGVAYDQPLPMLPSAEYWLAAMPDVLANSACNHVGWEILPC